MTISLTNIKLLKSSTTALGFSLIILCKLCIDFKPSEWSYVRRQAPHYASVFPIHSCIAEPCVVLERQRTPMAERRVEQIRNYCPACGTVNLHLLPSLPLHLLQCTPQAGTEVCISNFKAILLIVTAWISRCLRSNY